MGMMALAVGRDWIRLTDTIHGIDIGWIVDVRITIGMALPVIGDRLMDTDKRGKLNTCCFCVRQHSNRGVWVQRPV